MRDAVRVILVDPGAESRQVLQRQIEGLSDFELTEVCPAYEAAAKRIAALVPDLALVVVDDNLEQALELVKTIARSHPEVAVIPAGSDHDATLILRSIRAGAREFLPLPVDALELLETGRRVCPRRDPDTPTGPRGPQVIAVTGAAGGVGCSSIAVNLAACLAKFTRRDAVLADFDLLLGSLEESLAVIPDNSLEAVVRNAEDMDPGILKRWLPRHTCGLYMLPHPVSMEEAARLEPRALQQVLGLLRKAFDTIVVDTSKGLQVSDFLAFELADMILVVIQLNLNCTRNTVRLLEYLGHFEGLTEKVRLVVNRVNSPLSEISLKKAEELLRTRIRWQVPNATKLFRRARTRGVPIDEVDGGAGSKAHQSILNIARELHPFPAQPAAKAGGRRLFSAFR
jgi:pilus assembly protein CpaE